MCSGLTYGTLQSHFLGCESLQYHSSLNVFTTLFSTDLALCFPEASVLYSSKSPPGYKLLFYISITTNNTVQELSHFVTDFVVLR